MGNCFHREKKEKQIELPKYKLTQITTEKIDLCDICKKKRFGYFLEGLSVKNKCFICFICINSQDIKT